MKAAAQMNHRELLEEKRALEAMIARLEVSMTRGANWLISQFAPQGPIMGTTPGARDLSYCHKVVWGLFENNRLDEANRVQDWIEAHAKQAPGRYFFPEEPPFNREMQLLYRFLTFGRVAEALRHPAFANDQVRREVLAYQHVSGGAFGNMDKPEHMSAVNLLVTAFFGEWALAAGLVEAARRAGDFLVRMTALNAPHMRGEPGRCYFCFDPAADRLVTQAAPGENINCFIDTAGTKQHFYHLGAAMALLARLYAATGRGSYLDAAEELARFEQRLNPQGLYWPSYCKIGWGAAELYAVTGKPEHRVMAANVSEITFLGAQTASGAWEHMFYPLRDSGCWTEVRYDGTGHVPAQIQNDGSWAWLSGHEIAGEFLGEMGRTLKSFKSVLGAVQRRLMPHS